MNLHKIIKSGIVMIVITTFSVVLSLFVIEVGLRLYYRATNNRTTIQWRDDPVVGRRLLPNQKGTFVSNTGEYKTTIETNSQGFRDSEHSIEKPQDTYRILLLGDSFVENFQVPLNDTIFKQLELQLTEKLQKKIEIVAMGLGDTGTAQQYILLNELGMSYQPDLTMQFFFSGNDVKNNSFELMGDPFRPYFKVQDERLVEIPFSTRDTNYVNRTLSKIKSHSRAFEFLLNLKGRLMLRTTSEGLPVDYEVYKKEESSVYASAWNITEKLIGAVKETALEHGSQYILVDLANNEQINKSVQMLLAQKYPELNSEAFDYTMPDQKLLEICDRLQITCWFMLPYFTEYIQNHDNTVTHYPLDGHFNATGTKVATEFLVAKMESYLTIK